MTVQKGIVRRKNGHKLNVRGAYFVFQGVKSVVNVWNPKNLKRVPVEIFCVFNVGYSFQSVISVTNHIVSSTQIGGALLQTLVSSVKFVMKILMDIRTMMFYNEK